MSPSLAGVEPFRVDDRLEPGSYIAKPVTPVERKKSKSGGDPQIQVDWRVATGDWKGAEQREWITFTDRSLGNVVQVLQACGIEVPDKEFKDLMEMRDWVADELDKAPATEIVVRWEERTYVDDSGEAKTVNGPTIKGHRHPADGDLASSFDGSVPAVDGGEKRKDPF